VLGAAALVAGALLAWPRPHAAAVTPVQTAPARARVYLGFTACLLTGPGGIEDAGAAPVWSGLRAASAATRAQISYVPLQGPQTAANADAYITALALRGCSLILTDGAVPGQGAEDRAGALPRTRFIVVDTPATTAPNVTAVGTTTAAAVTGQIDSLVTSAVQQSTVPTQGTATRTGTPTP
jgi:hypothetical protein